MSTGMESAQSVSSVIYYRGVSMTVTKRDLTVDMMPLIKAQMKDIDELLDNGCQPSWNPDTNAAAAKLPRSEEPPHPGTITRTSGNPGENGMYCQTCKQPAQQKQGVSRKGQPYNAVFCSSGDRSHTLWL